MQDRMLDAADILIDRQPALGLRAVERLVGGLAGEADEIPARIDEGIERIGLAARGAVAIRALHLVPGGVPLERVARYLEADIVGKHDGELLARHRHRTAGIAVDDRDRRPPVTLAGN